MGIAFPGRTITAKSVRQQGHPHDSALTYGREHPDAVGTTTIRVITTGGDVLTVERDA